MSRTDSLLPSRFIRRDVVPGRELGPPHHFRRRHLETVRLPIPPSRHFGRAGALALRQNGRAEATGALSAALRSSRFVLTGARRLWQSPGGMRA